MISNLNIFLGWLQHDSRSSPWCCMDWQVSSWSPYLWIHIRHNDSRLKTLQVIKSVIMILCVYYFSVLVTTWLKTDWIHIWIYFFEVTHCCLHLNNSSMSSTLLFHLNLFTSFLFHISFPVPFQLNFKIMKINVRLREGFWKKKRESWKHQSGPDYLLSPGVVVVLLKLFAFSVLFDSLT